VEEEFEIFVEAAILMEMFHDTSTNRTAPGAALALMAMLIGTVPAAERHIYPEPERAEPDLAAALETAAAAHKRVLVDFGGDWCPDCQALDIYFHDAANSPLLAANYVLVHVNIGRMDQNLALAARLKIPLKKGVPALAVLGEDGKLIYSQQAGEFEAMRHMRSADVTEFLTRWTAS
jgi:thiol:disulfide interchange protein